LSVPITADPAVLADVGARPRGQDDGPTSRLRGPIWVGLLGRRLALVVLVVVVAYLVLVPVALILWGSFRDGPPGTDASFTFSKYVDAYTSASVREALLNSFVFAFGSTVLSVAVGAYLAWVTERTDTPFRGVIYALALLPIITPGVMSAVSWILLLDPQIGILNSLWSTMTPFDGPLFDIYSMTGMIWAQTTDLFSLPFLLIVAAMRAMDPSLEEASRIAGAGRLRTVRRVTLRLLTPTLIAATLLTAVRAIETFEVPAAIGLPARERVFASEVWLATTGGGADSNLAAALAVVYLLVTAFGLLLYYRATRASDKFTTVSGKAFRPERESIGGLRFFTLGTTLLLLFVMVLMPTLAIAWSSLLPYLQVPSVGALQVLTLDNYSAVLERDSTRGALVNNIVVGLAAASVAVLLASLIAWVAVRSKLRGRKLLDGLATVPVAFPGVMMGLALIWVYLTLPIPIYGTLWIIGIGYVASYLPYGVRAAHASLSQVSSQLEEASVVCGASWFRTFRRVTLPLITPSLIAAFVYILTLTFKVLGLPAMLVSVDNAVLPVVLFDLYEAGYYPQFAALGMLMIALILVLAGVGKLIAKRFQFGSTS
jgi:iron(III) transport system permease protein